jgi:hypothetical protein
MKKLVTPEVFNKAVDAAEQLAACEGYFQDYYESFLAKNPDKEMNAFTHKALLNDFDSLQWYTALFPVNEITLYDPNLPEPQTVDLQKIAKAVESTKLFLNVLYQYPDLAIDYNECSDHIDSLQGVADYIKSLAK